LNYREQRFNETGNGSIRFLIGSGGSWSASFDLHLEKTGNHQMLSLRLWLDILELYKVSKDSSTWNFKLKSLVMGPGQNFLTRIGSGRVSHLWFGFEFGKFLLKVSNFSIFFLSGQKNLFGSGQKVPGSKAGSPLINCGSKVSSGRVRAHLYKSWSFIWPVNLSPWDNLKESIKNSIIMFFFIK